MGRWRFSNFDGHSSETRWRSQCESATGMASPFHLRRSTALYRYRQRHRRMPIFPPFTLLRLHCRAMGSELLEMLSRGRDKRPDRNERAPSARRPSVSAALRTALALCRPPSACAVQLRQSHVLCAQVDAMFHHTWMARCRYGAYLASFRTSRPTIICRLPGSRGNLDKKRYPSMNLRMRDRKCPESSSVSVMQMANEETVCGRCGRGQWTATGTCSSVGHRSHGAG